MSGLIGHDEELGFYTLFDGKLPEGFKEMSDVILFTF